MATTAAEAALGRAGAVERTAAIRTATAAVAEAAVVSRTPAARASHTAAGLLAAAAVELRLTAAEQR